MDPVAATKAERTELLELLEQLQPDRWNEQTLCAAWKVRHAVAHLTGGTEMKVAPFLGQMVKSGLNFNKAIAAIALRDGDAPVPDVLNGFRAAVESERRPPGAKPMDVLLDNLVHQQDIRRPLGASRVLAEDRAVAVAEHAAGNRFPFGARKRIAGLKLRAEDAEWSTGDGPEVSGPIEALILMLVKRPAGLVDLKGEGLETLASRM